MGSKRRVEMPKEGTWFPIADELIHRCCDCGAVHKWEFGWIELDTPEGPEWSRAMKITRIDKEE